MPGAPAVKEGSVAPAGSGGGAGGEAPEKFYVFGSENLAFDRILHAN